MLPPPPTHDPFETMRRDAGEAKRVAHTALVMVTRIDKAVGESPDPAQGVPGRGMLGVMTEFVNELNTERAARKRRSAFFGAVGGVLVTAAAVAEVGRLALELHR